MRIHNYRHPHKAQFASHDIEPIRLHPIHRLSPEERQYNEYAAICGIHATNVGLLKCRNDAIENNNGGTRVL